MKQILTINFAVWMIGGAVCLWTIGNIGLELLDWLERRKALERIEEHWASCPVLNVWRYLRAEGGTGEGVYGGPGVEQRCRGDPLEGLFIWYGTAVGVFRCRPLFF